jgi:DNA repair protein RadB
VRIPTGCRVLDDLLRGGLSKGELVLIYGEAATGKTTTVIQAAVGAAKSGLKTLYVDADHSFTQQRFRQIAGSESGEISQLILLFLPETFSEQRNIVESLENYVTSTLGLVIVDSVSSLYRASFSGPDSIFALNRDLSRQVAYLKELSESRKIACILTSQVHSRLAPPAGDIEPVARRTLFHFPQTIMRVRNTPKPNVREFVVERFGGSDVARSCLIELGESGLMDVST